MSRFTPPSPPAAIGAVLPREEDAIDKMYRALHLCDQERHCATMFSAVEHALLNVVSFFSFALLVALVLVVCVLFRCCD
jgi:hypothetical protein